jgi:hypothetical protein
MPERIERAVLGGIPDGRPLGRLDLAQARAFAEHGTEVTDPVTRNYVTLAERVAGLNKPGIVYTATRKEAERLAEDLGGVAGQRPAVHVRARFDNKPTNKALLRSSG